jgi:hypothetical protein
MRTFKIFTSFLAAAALCATAIQGSAADVPEPKNVAPGGVKFTMHRVGNIRSEACAVADFNGDGKPDIIAGEFLYLAPDFKPVKVRTIKGTVDEQGKGYRNDFANLALDVDGDGKPDVISVDWFDKHAIWLKNIGAAGQEWPQTVIEENGNFETGELADVLGKGKENCVLPAVKRTVWYELVGKGKFDIHVVSEKPMNFGGGVGDINGDGRPDIIRPDAWFEAPADPRKGQWIEHPIILGSKDGAKSEHTAQILVFDVNGDGLNDLICSSAHRYGIFWYEQVREGGEIKFKQHVIDDTWTQAHSLALGDLDGDGKPELVAGKRFMAHNGKDPEEFAPLGVYYYKLQSKPEVKWSKHVISYNQGVGSGMSIGLVDMDGDGDLDVVVTGKFGGPVWFENKTK